jgi:integrase
MHADGDGLYLKISLNQEGFRKRWLLIFRWNRKRCEMGLGSARQVSLAEARILAESARRLVRDGLNPIEQRRASRITTPTFEIFANDLIDTIQTEFRNAKHRKQWRNTLATYCSSISRKPVDEITTDDVVDILRPIWTTKSETASRVRGRLERVLDAAKSRGLRTGDNPARWRGHLANLLPRRPRLARGHHAAMAYRDVPQFFDRLQAAESISAFALGFCVLTATRSGEVLGARWSEVDRENGLWTVPAERTKAGRVHRVPLSARARAILDKVEVVRTGDYVFPGQKRNHPLSSMALEMALRRMKVTGITVHGFRSSFRDWAAEETTSPREVAEAALGHVVGDATERAYRRGDALEKRRRLMEEWANYCAGLSRPTTAAT